MAFRLFWNKGCDQCLRLSVNEDLYAALERDTAMYTRIPVQLLTDANDIVSDGQEDGISEAAADETADPETGSAAVSTAQKTIPLSFLTAREGLPETRFQLNELRKPVYETPVVEQYEVYEDTEHTQASIFQKHGVMALVMGGAAVVIAAVYGAYPGGRIRNCRSAAV